MNIYQALARCIDEDASIDHLLLSDDQAIELAQEISEAGNIPAAEVYQSIALGQAKFKDRPIVVEVA